MLDEPGLFEAPVATQSSAKKKQSRTNPVATARRNKNKQAVGDGTLMNGINDDVATQGIKYAGSKLKLIPHIVRLIRGLPVETVFDGFSGTTRVSQALAKCGYSVASNDRAEWSECFGKAYLLNEKPAQHYQELIDHLNSIAPTHGWFSEHYGGLDEAGLAVQKDGSKRLWQMHNAMKLDGIRNAIDDLQLDEVTRCVALSSLILALDRVDSTMGHFAAYLREWAPRSYLEMKLEVPMLWENSRKHSVSRQDIFECVSSSTESVDLAYYDPPYGSNNEKMPPSRVRYQSYYHVWKTVILNDQPEVFGAANRRVDSSDTVAGSVFEEFRRSETGRFIAMESIDRLIASTKSPFVALSYSNGGRTTAAELDDVLRSHGNIIKVAEIDYKRNVMSGMRWTNEWVRDREGKNLEYIFLLEK